MDLPIFYAPPDACGETSITLSREEAHHAVRVMRLTKGKRLIVVDGLGHAWRGEIRSAGEKEVEVHVHESLRNFGEPLTRVTLAAGLSVGSKFDTVVQKGTELGVKRFVPIISEKSKVKIEDPKRAVARVHRLEKVALAAIKQCRRSYRPDITTPTGFYAFLGETDPKSMNLLFHAIPGALSLDRLSIKTSFPRVSLLVGPEAGFTDEEAARAMAAGYTPISLGPRVLRTETAGPVVCALVMNALGELS